MAPYTNLCEYTLVEPQGRLLALLTVKRFTVLYAEQCFELQDTVESFVLQTCVNRFTIYATVKKNTERNNVKIITL